MGAHSSRGIAIAGYEEGATPPNILFFDKFSVDNWLVGRFVVHH